MKKGTIFRNLWAGHETYFVYQGSIPAKGMRPATSYGYKLVLYPYSEKWKVSKASYYTHDLLNDREHFPVVGHIDMDKLMTDAILSAIKRGNDGA
nr:hypothetical protein [Clostridia bacterium]